MVETNRPEEMSSTPVLRDLYYEMIDGVPTFTPVAPAEA